MHFMLCTTDHARNTILNIPVQFGQSIPCFKAFFIAMLHRNLRALIATADWILRLSMKELRFY